MKRQTEGFAERILASAEKEFLKKGYLDASLRDIAADCGVSTSMIYTRFTDKAGLFDALVKPSLDELLSWYNAAQEEFLGYDRDVQIQTLPATMNTRMIELVDYLYDHLNAFRLLALCSAGTAYENLVDNFANKHTDYTIRFIEATGSDILSSGRLTPELLHILSTAVYAGIFETVMHDMSRDEAHSHVRKLIRFFMSGWMDLFREADDAAGEGGAQTDE